MKFVQVLYKMDVIKNAYNEIFICKIFDVLKKADDEQPTISKKEVEGYMHLDIIITNID